jgi:nucleoside-diphosphate-sugar epimerase
MKATFVIGGTGYIGGALAERLSADGNEVRALARTPRTEAELRRLGHIPVPGTLADLDVLQRAAAEADAVVWTVMSLNPADYPGMEAALAALNDALEGSGKPLLCMGGGIVYSDTGDGPVGEGGALDDTPMATHALEVERVALEGAERGVRSIAIRSSLVYGRGDGMFVRGPIDSARELGEARYVGSGAMKMSTVHVDDLVDLLARALREALPGSIFNAAAEPPVTTLELAEATARAAGVERTASVAPERAWEVLGFLGGVMAKNLWLSIDRARDLLGWSPGQPSIVDELATGSYASSWDHERTRLSA